MKSMYQYPAEWQLGSFNQNASVQASSLEQVYVILRNVSKLTQTNTQTLSTYVNPLRSIQLSANGTLFPSSPMVCNTTPAVGR